MTDNLDIDSKLSPQELVSKYLSIVHFTIHRYFSNVRSIEYEDLHALGNMALWLAAKKWRPNKGANFSTFSIKCIKCVILKELRKQYAVKRQGTVISLNAPVGNGKKLEDVIRMKTRSSEDSVVEQITYAELMEKVRRLLKTKKYQNIRGRILRFLLENGPQAQATIGEAIGYSQAQVSRLVRRIRNDVLELAEKYNREESSCDTYTVMAKHM